MPAIGVRKIRLGIPSVSQDLIFDMSMGSGTSTELQQDPSAPSHGTKQMGAPKTSAQCSLYQDGTASGNALYKICQAFPNSPKSNRMRGCLQCLYDPGARYFPVPIIIPGVVPGGGADLDTIIPETGDSFCAAMMTNWLTAENSALRERRHPSTWFQVLATKWRKYILHLDCLQDVHPGSRCISNESPTRKPPRGYPACRFGVRC